LATENGKRRERFSELQSHYLFAEKFGRPARGNDKGKVEGPVGHAPRNFMVTIPQPAASAATPLGFRTRTSPV
jgi:transposase